MMGWGDTDMVLCLLAVRKQAMKEKLLLCVVQLGCAHSYWASHWLQCNPCDQFRFQVGKKVKMHSQTH